MADIQQEAADLSSSILGKSAAPNTSLPSPNSNPVAPVPNMVLGDIKKKREDAATNGDYAGAVWRQDSPVPGMIAHYQGSQFKPEEGYMSYADPEQWKALTEGVAEEYHKELYGATSPAQAEFIKQRLLNKQADLQHLGDMGAFGNSMRLAANLVEPVGLATGLMSGGLSWAVRGRKLATMASAIGKAGTEAEALAAITAHAGEAAAQAAGNAGSRAVATGIATGAGTMGAVERLRQRVNFEDDWGQVVEASLIAGAMTAPFAVYGARSAARQANAARQEFEAWRLLKEQKDGTPVTPADAATLDIANHRIEVYSKVERGELPSDAIDALWKQHESELAVQRERQMNDIWSEGQLHKGSEMQDVTKALDATNDVQPSVMQLAFQKALGISQEAKAAAKETPLHLQDVPKTPTPVSELQGDHVFWRSDDGPGLDHGAVVGETGKGQLIIEHADTGERMLIDRADLHPDSPGHHFEIPTEAVAGEPDFLPKGMQPEPHRVTKADFLKGPESVEPLPVRSAQQSASTALPESSSGFLGGSAGAAQAMHVPTVPTVLGGFIPKLDKWGIKIPYRFDLYAQLNRSTNPVIQKWASKLIKDPIGAEGSHTQARTASEDKKFMQRTLEGQFMLTAQDAFREVRVKRKLGPLEAHKFHREFYEMVSNVANGDSAVIHANPDIANELRAAANAQREVYSSIIKEAKKAGVQGAENLDVDAFYVNRQYQIDKIKEKMKAHGEDEVARVLANAFTDGALHGDLAKAKAFLHVILKTEFSQIFQDLHLASKDMHTLRAELGAVDPATDHPLLDAKDINAIVEVMFEARAKQGGDSGNATNLKFRMPMDENYSERMANGETLKISDLMERDSRVLVNKYLNTMAGHVAMAKRGIRSRAEFEKIIYKGAMDHHMENNLLVADDGKFKGDIQWMRDIYDNITGRPMSTQVFNQTSRLSNIVRAYSRSAYLGQLGIPAMGELKQAVAMTSLRALHLQGGSFAGLIRSLRSGRIPNQKLAREIEQFWAFGLEANSAHARQFETSEFTHDRTLNKLENATNQLSHAVDYISGNATVTAMTRQYSAMMFIQHHFDLATGAKELTPAYRKRLAHYGMELDEIDDVLKHLKEYTTHDATNGRVESVDWERWKQEHPATFEQYHLTVERSSRDAIQDHDLGETIPWAHTQLGKIFMELRTFIAVAHAKNFLKNVHYMDKTTFSVWMYGLVGEALMYSLQTSLNLAHNPEELQKRLTMDRIAKSAIQRASVFGMLPSAISTTTGLVAGGYDPFAMVSTANTDNRNMFTPPSAVLIGKAINAGRTISGSAPWSDRVATKQDIRDLFGIMPGGNTYGIRNLSDYVSGMFPKHAPRQVVP